MLQATVLHVVLLSLVGDVDQWVSLLCDAPNCHCQGQQGWQSESNCPYHKLIVASAWQESEIHFRFLHLLISSDKSVLIGRGFGR